MRRSADGPILAIVALAVVCGCVTGRAAREEVTAALERARTADAWRAAAYGRMPGKPPSTSTPIAVKERNASAPANMLEEFLGLALEHNPQIKSAEQVARATSQRWAQVTSLPDPLVAMKILPEPIRTAEGDNRFILGVSQKFPMPEKLDRAGRMALEEMRMALEALRETRLHVVAAVKRSYFALYALEKSIEITRANQELLRGLIDVTHAQIATGRRGQDDALRAQVELSNLQAELIVLRQRRVTTVARLNELLARAPMTPVTPPPEFDVRTDNHSVEDLMVQAVEFNPKLRRLRRKIMRDGEAVKLAALAYWPDVTIGAEWIAMDPRGAFKPPINPTTGRRPMVSQMSENGSDNWAVTVGFNLPIWRDKIEAGIGEAQSRLAASRQAYASAKNTVRYVVQDALDRVESQRELARLFFDTIIPQAEQTYRVSQASYTAGSSDFLQVIDNWRKWLGFSIQYHRALGQLERSVADLEEAVGLSLAEVRESK